MHRTLRLVIPLVVVLVAVSTVLIFPTGHLVAGSQTPVSNRGVTALARPAIPSAATFLDQEAGITGYVNLAHTIDLTSVATHFRTIEQQTPNYVVGSVPVPGYAVQDDIHAFVTATGWVAGYYNKTEPASKFVDWQGYIAGSTTIPNKLATGLGNLALGISSANLQYYDFAYPSANNLYVIADQSTFYITIPSPFNLQEVSYSSSNSVGLIPSLSLNTRHSVQCRGFGQAIIVDGFVVGTCNNPYFLVLVYFG